MSKTETEGSYDIVPSEVRSRMMRSVRQRNTIPELAVRRLVNGLGSSYRLNNRRLPGSPDISNARAGWAIFVHGCFWHGHRNCKRTKGGKSGRIPLTRSDFWRDKLARNRERDAIKARNLRSIGLRVLVIWECELRNEVRLRRKLATFLTA